MSRGQPRLTPDPPPTDAGNKTYVYLTGGDAQGRPSLFVLEVGAFNDATAFRDQILLPTPEFAETLYGGHPPPRSSLYGARRFSTQVKSGG